MENCEAQIPWNIPIGLHMAPKAKALGVFPKGDFPPKEIKPWKSLGK